VKKFHSKKISKKDTTKHLNFMGGNSWDISNPITKLRIAASSCFFGEPKYYTETKEKTVSYDPYISNSLGLVGDKDWSGKSSQQIMELAIDAALDFDPELTLIEAARLRNEDHIRTTPQVILVRAAHHNKVKGTGLVRKWAKQIIKRADEPSVGLAYHKFVYKSPIPNSLKKAWKESLEGFSEYQLAKYRMENKNVKTVDVMNICHPKSEAISKLAKGKLKTTGETWEAILSKNGASKSSWKTAIPKMGHMALLRNLRNFNDHSVKEDLYIDKLVSTAEKGEQLPFRYVSAYFSNQNSSARVKDAIEECLMISLGNLPKFSGNVMSLCDNSGSAQTATTSSMGTMKVSTIANLTGLITSKVSDNGTIGAFGDKLKTMQVRKGTSIFDDLEKFEKECVNDIGQSTENGIWLFWDKAIKNKEHWDHVFIYSDMQAGHGGLYGINKDNYKDFLWKGSRNIDVPKLISKYRSEVNKDVKVYLVQVAGYTDTIVPEWYDKTYILGGWGDGLLRFADAMSKITK
jgi:hypothetical protein